jgi:hypothetical protein
MVDMALHNRKTTIVDKIKAPCTWQQSLEVQKVAQINKTQ